MVSDPATIPAPITLLGQSVYGRRGRWAVDGAIIRVYAGDAEYRRGRLRYRVTPVAGDGWIWVDAACVDLDAADYAA